MVRPYALLDAEEMRTLLILLVSILLTNRTSGQPADSTHTHDTTHPFTNLQQDERPLLQGYYDAKGSKRWISKDHITMVTHKLRLTPMEDEILEMESRECRALLKRDTTALKEIWLRDFTLDEPQNELHLGKNTIPYYVGIHRTIEKVTILDTVIYISGHENVGLLKGDGKVVAPIFRQFNHAWTKKLFSWKLASKTYE